MPASQYQCLSSAKNRVHHARREVGAGGVVAVHGFSLDQLLDELDGFSGSNSELALSELQANQHGCRGLVGEK
jgi:hypothetical protein